MNGTKRGLIFDPTKNRIFTTPDENSFFYNDIISILD